MKVVARWSLLTLLLITIPVFYVATIAFLWWLIIKAGVLTLTSGSLLIGLSLLFVAYMGLSVRILSSRRTTFFKAPLVGLALCQLVMAFLTYYFWANFDGL